tara:strand:+ start:213 stop:1130 length:918 start_codon:yes stop_codon:yes gene_type:complete
MSDTARRFLVFRRGGLGDFLLTLPVFDALRRVGAGTTISLAGRPAPAELAQRAGRLDRVYDIDAAMFAPLFADDPVPGPALRACLAEHDIVISFLHRPQDPALVLMRESGIRTALCIAPQPVAGHAADHFIAPLAELGIAVTCPVQPTLPGPPGDKDKRPREGVIIHPGSGSPDKNWPLAHFMTLARALANGDPLTFLIGEAEPGVGALLRQDGWNVVEDAPLIDVADRLAQARVYIGNDSGITHLAAALGTPTVALFGPTDPNVWAPRGDHVLVLGANAMDQIRVRDVLEAARSGCSRTRPSGP